MNRVCHQNNVEMHKAVRALFRDKWDPIGVSGDIYAADEYDVYADKVRAMLAAGASDAELNTYLIWVVEERIGLVGQADPNRNIEIIKLVRDLTK